jgi:hypothetical protein
LRFYLENASIYSYQFHADFEWDVLPGDLNGDGVVKSDDLDVVRAFWGQSVPAGDLTRGDATGDGAVNSADLDVVRMNWGTRRGSAVPEPGLLTLVTFVLTWSMVVRREIHHRSNPK